MLNEYMKLQMRLNDSKKLSKELGMSVNVFEEMINVGVNPNYHIGAISFETKK